MIKVLVYPIKSAPTVKEIEGSLESMQAIVGGWIEAVNLGALANIRLLDFYTLICNEEGKILELEPNRFFPFDYIAGTFFITKEDDEGNSISLTDEDIELIKKYVR